MSGSCFQVGSLNLRYDFDRWRREYPTSTFAQQQIEWDTIYEAYPHQRFWHSQPVVDALHTPGMSVTELGGWRGELADAVIPVAEPHAWINYDLCPAAIANSACRWLEYHPVLLDNWPWEVGLAPADVFVATHVIEHMMFDELTMLAEQSRKWATLVIEAPIVQSATSFSWVGNGSTHILEVGWSQVCELFASHGFELTGTYRDTRTFTRR
jgi:hypothetical protein